MLAKWLTNISFDLDMQLSIPPDLFSLGDQSRSGDIITIHQIPCIYRTWNLKHSSTTWPLCEYGLLMSRENLEVLLCVTGECVCEFVTVCRLLSHHSAVCRFTSTVAASLLIPIDPPLIRPIAAGFPVFVATDPIQSNNPNWRWDWISAAVA